SQPAPRWNAEAVVCAKSGEGRSSRRRRFAASGLSCGSRLCCAHLAYYFLLPDPAAQVHPVGVAGIDIAGIVDADAFQRAEVNGLGNELRDIAVLGAADADALLEARVGLVGRLRVGDVDH